MVPADPRGAHGMVPADREAALWAEIKLIVERARLTYKAAQVRPRSVASLSGLDGWYLEVVWTEDGTLDNRSSWRRRTFAGTNAAWIMRDLREAFSPALTYGKDGLVLNLRDFGAGGVKPRPWGPFDLPDDVVNVSRSGHNEYASAFPFDNEADRTLSLSDYYASALRRNDLDPEWIRGLDGKRLACWCKPPEGFQHRLRCHAQILVAIRDGVVASEVE